MHGLFRTESKEGDTVHLTESIDVLSAIDKIYA